MNPRRSSKNILVVDDEPMVRRSCEMLLRHLGHKVETAENGLEALAKVGHSHFDVALIDFEMSGMCGDELAREIRRVKPNLPLVLMTGSIPLRPAPNFAGQLVKPFSLAELQTVLETWSWT